MDPTIVAAIIALAGTFGLPIATYIGTRYFDNRDKQVITSGQRAEISGRWEGTTSQENGEYSGISLPIVLTAVAKGKTVTGKFHVQYPGRADRPAEEDEFTLQGGFLYDRFLQLDYISTNKHRIQFGSIILELSPIGEGLSGRYAGYGALSKQIVSGNIELRRTA
jgi:hypothetical protein